MARVRMNLAEKGTCLASSLSKKISVYVPWRILDGRIVLIRVFPSIIDVSVVCNPRHASLGAVQCVRNNSTQHKICKQRPHTKRPSDLSRSFCAFAISSAETGCRFPAVTIRLQGLKIVCRSIVDHCCYRICTTSTLHHRKQVVLFIVRHNYNKPKRLWY
jgi:hypothetical protein